MLRKRSENVLVVKTDALAAFVNAEPYFEAIREAHPDARISLLTVEALQRVARAAPYFDHVAVAPNLNDADAKRAFVRQLREARFSRVYDLSGDDLARKIQAAFGVMGPKWLCAAPSGRRARDVVEALRAGPNAARLSSVGVEAPERLPDFTWALDARKDSANMKPSWFGVSGAFGLLLPGIDPERRWPARHYGEFARMMARGGVMPVIVGSRDIHGFADKIAEVAPEVVDLTGKADHLQLASLAREATFFVSDSAEEVELAVSVGCAGVLIKRLGEEDASPVGRHLMTLTVRHSMEEATPDFVWRSLRNMGLIPEEADRAMVLER